MDFIFQRTGAPDDTILIRRKGRASYTIKIANHTEDYFAEGVLHEYELKDYIELLYLSSLEDVQPYDYLQISFPYFPAILRNIKQDRKSYEEWGYDFPFLNTFADMISACLQAETWPSRTKNGGSIDSEEKPVVATSAQRQTWSEDFDSTTEH